MPHTYFIPAMLLVHGASEGDAARNARDLLAPLADGPVLEKFVLPNHQRAIGGHDEDERLVFVPLDVYRDLQEP